MINRGAIAVLLVLISLFTFAQDVPSIKAKYPAEDAAYVYIKHHYVITDNGGELPQVTDNVEESIAYLTSNDLRYAHESIFYSSFSKIEDINAFTQVPAGKPGKFKDVKVENFKTKDYISGGIFYEDHKQIEFTFPGVQEGAVTRLSYKEILTDPRMMSVFYFNSYLPLQQAELKVTFPDNIKLAYQLFGENTDKVKFTESKSGKNVTYTWTATDLPEYKYEEGAPSRSYYDPHIVVRISSYKKNSKDVPLLGNVDDLYSWYASLVKDANKADDKELKAMVKDLTAGAPTEREKARRLYQWVQSNINYVAFEDGMGGFIPRDAVNVCNKKFGDCKDMANLLQRMMEYAGLKSYLTWIGTRHRPYTYAEMPTPMVDNHMIAMVELDGENVFLDATGKYIPFGLPSPMIQGKEALVGKSEKEYKIVKVPVVNMDRNVMNDTTFVKISGKNLSGEGVAHHTGFAMLNLADRFYGGNQKDEKEFFQSILIKGSNKFNLISFSHTDIDNRDKPSAIKYEYSIPDYVKTSADKMYINLNLDKQLSTAQLDLDKRKYPREFEFKSKDNNRVVLLIPDGYAVEYLPESVKDTREKYGFSITYKQEGDKIIMDKQMYTNTIMLNPADFKDWNDYIGKLNKSYKETIVLVKK